MDLYEYVNIFICSAVLALLSRNVNEESENKDKWKSRIGCFEVIVMTNKIHKSRVVSIVTSQRESGGLVVAVIFIFELSGK